MQGIISAPLVLTLGSMLSPQVGQSVEITPQGKALAKFLDDMHVEKFWLAKHSVAWKTGEPLAKQVPDGKAHTHCSAFVAAACLRSEIYILRPPEHGTVLLANAQYDWLRDSSAKKGWKPVESDLKAQQLANRGLIVVASFREDDSKKAGHIAIVRPSKKSAQKIQEEGPQIIQAGASNHRSTSLKEGFKHHPAAWKDHKVRYYAHEWTGASP